MDRDHRPGSLRPTLDLRTILLPCVILVSAGVLVVGFLPAALWLAGLGAAIAASRHFGEWPTFLHPGAPTLVGEAPFLWLQWAIPLLVVLALVAWILVEVHRRVGRRVGYWALTIPPVAAMGWAAGMALLSFDPLGVMAWYFN